MGDLAGGHRARAGGDGLAAPDDRPARRSCRRHPGHRLHRHARGPAHRPGAGHRARPAPAGTRRRQGRRSPCTRPSEAHSSMDKAVQARRLWPRRCAISRPTTRARCDPRRWRGPSHADRAAGSGPRAWSATVGTTSSTAVDPLRADRRALPPARGVAARGRGVRRRRRHRPRAPGAVRRDGGADSLVFNPHKWLLTNFDCTAYFVRDPSALLRARSRPRPNISAPPTTPMWSTSATGASSSAAAFGRSSSGS